MVLDVVALAWPCRRRCGRRPRPSPVGEQPVEPGERPVRLAGVVLRVHARHRGARRRRRRRRAPRPTARSGPTRKRPKRAHQLVVAVVARGVAPLGQAGEEQRRRPDGRPPVVGERRPSRRARPAGRATTRGPGRRARARPGCRPARHGRGPSPRPRGARRCSRRRPCRSRRRTGTATCRRRSGCGRTSRRPRWPRRQLRRGHGRAALGRRQHPEHDDGDDRATQHGVAQRHRPARRHVAPPSQLDAVRRSPCRPCRWPAAAPRPGGRRAAERRQREPRRQRQPAEHGATAGPPSIRVPSRSTTVHRRSGRPVLDAEAGQPVEARTTGASRRCERRRVDHAARGRASTAPPRSRARRWPGTRRPRPTPRPGWRRGSRPRSTPPRSGWPATTARWR